MKTLCWFAFAAAVAGCDPVSVTALTPPPPGKVADLDDESLDLELSRGTALAFECTAHNTEYSGPCRNARAKTSDGEVAIVYASYLDTLIDSWDDQGYAGTQARVAFVVVGLAEGKTDLEVITADGDVNVSVTIVP
jgi:hypothetical protein